MSLDVDLTDPVNQELCKVNAHTEGGTYALGGTTDATLNITVNYGRVVRHAAAYAYTTREQPHVAAMQLRNWMEHAWKALDGRSAKEAVDELEVLVEVLGDKPWDDYWAPTPGNAGHAAAVLLRWARQHPSGIWVVR